MSESLLYCYFMIAVTTFYVSVWLKNKLLTMFGGADLNKATFVRSKYRSF